MAKCGDKFIMDHGVARPQGQDLMRFYQSKDLRHWEYITSTEPDDRWYRRDRWDHMYMLPKEEGKPEAGYWGYVVAVPKQGVDLPAMMQSPDGLKWEVLPPAKTEWGNTPPRNHFEYGGCERIGGKYYLIGGTGGYMGCNRATPCSRSLRRRAARALPPRCRSLPPLRQLRQRSIVAGRLGARQRRDPDQQLRLHATWR